jgi:4-amino-4-deoxy-L-arabinose transferase-like glycosyltransferase
MAETFMSGDPEGEKDRGIWLLLGLAGVSFAAHMLVAGNYGYFRDELYYLADGRHLQAGYVDQPALVGWLAALLRVFAGDSLVAIHVIPALACGLVIVVTGLMTRELGGGVSAQLVAGVATLFSVDHMAAGSIFSMDVLDQLWWALASLVLLRMLRRDTPRLWLLFGLVAAMGFLTKLTMLFFGLAVTLALLATRERRHLRTRWPWLAAGIAVAGLVPFVMWNAVNGWPTWDFYRTYRYLGTSPLAFFASQLALMNPMALPLAGAGLVFYFRKAGARYRLLGWTFAFLYVMLTVIRGKPYFLGPAYPILFAAGAVVLEQFTRRPRLAWIRPVSVAALTLVGLLLAPYAMPILPPAAFARIYGTRAAAAGPAAAEDAAEVFPQNLADRFGWDTLTQTVEQVYDALPPGQRAQACVLASNYGEASALSLLAAPGRLPPIISGHNNYFVWGPGACTGQVLIVVGYSHADVQSASASYAHITLAATRRCRYCVAHEREVPVYVLSGPTRADFDLRELWPVLKHFD